MRKICLMLTSILFFAVSLWMIGRLQDSNFKTMNCVSQTLAESLQDSLAEAEDLSFSALLCNEVRVPFDDSSNTFYVPVNMESSQWEALEFTSGQPEYNIVFGEDITENNKKNVIADGKRFELIVYDNKNWTSYGVVFTGLPMIDLATKEGIYAAEELTGKAVFYDTDFAVHGAKESEFDGHIRGNTSRMFPKKGYKLNLISVDSQGQRKQNKMSLFGLRKDDDWILYAMYNDDSKIRDALSMEVWDRMGAANEEENSYYGTRMTYVEVVADNQYCGLYGLMEPIDAKQLNLAEGDVTYKRKNPGGLKNKYDMFLSCTDPTAQMEGFEVKAGKTSEHPWLALANLSAFLSLDEEELKGREQDIINEDSLLKTWLFLQLITGHDHTAKNLFYIAKYDDSLQYDYQFSFAPWDMDLTWGNVSVGEINPLYTAFEWDTVDDRVYWETADWMIGSDYHQARERVLKLYQQLREEAISDQALEEMITGLDEKIRTSGAFARDEGRWPESAHAKDTNKLLRYAKARMKYLDRAIEDFKYFEE